MTSFLIANLIGAALIGLYIAVRSRCEPYFPHEYPPAAPMNWRDPGDWVLCLLAEGVLLLCFGWLS